MANWDDRNQMRADAIAFSEQVLSDRRDSAWLSGLPTPPPAPNADGCVITYLGHIVPGDDEAGQWCETHRVKFALGERCPSAMLSEKPNAAAQLCQYHVVQAHRAADPLTAPAPARPVAPSECEHPEHDAAFEEHHPEAKRINDEWRRYYERPAVPADPASDLGSMDCFNCKRHGIHGSMHKHADGYWRCDRCGREWSAYYKSKPYP